MDEPNEEPSKDVCKKCGAELEEVGDGKLYCFICESYPSGEPEKPKELTEAPVNEEPKKNEAQAFLDSLATSVPPAAAPATNAVVEASPEIRPGISPEEPAPAATREPTPSKASEIRMCDVCGQPLKYIDKYQRHYCYGCRKYAPKKGASEAPKPPLHTPPNRRTCPSCRGELRYIEKYKELYCYACKCYPLRRSSKPSGVAKPVNPKTVRLACPSCGDQLRWIDRYQRHYCYSCKTYAPKGFGLERKSCPICKGSMKFVSEYNEWYCYKCKKYSLRPSKPILLV